MAAVAAGDPRVSLVPPPKGLTIHQVHAAAAVRDYQVYPLLGKLQTNLIVVSFDSMACIDGNGW
jgi:hypothetical protein